MLSGLALIDKPADWSSHDVVAKARSTLKIKRVGHAGTLDPMATGLLVLGIGAGTKLLTFLVGADKSYTATIRLGQSTISDDAEGEILSVSSEDELNQINKELILSKMKDLTGEILQRPSSVSAIKISGQRAYDLVRAGKEVELKPRAVTVYSFELLSDPKMGAGFIDLEVRVDCSSGTYVRALARDLGEALSVGGHLIKLRRTKVANYLVSEAQTVEEIANLKILPLADAAAEIFPVIRISNQSVADLIHGKRIAGAADTLVAAIDERGELVAILEPKENNLKSVVVFQGANDD